MYKHGLENPDILGYYHPIIAPCATLLIEHDNCMILSSLVSILVMLSSFPASIPSFSRIGGAGDKAFSMPVIGYLAEFEVSNLWLDA